MKLMNDLWNTLRYKSEVETNNPGLSEDENDMGWNIYTTPKTKRKDFAKRFAKVHAGLKHKAIIPALFICEKFIKEYVHENTVPYTVPSDKLYNREWVVFEKAYNEALEDFVLKYFFGSDAQTHPEVVLWRLKNDRSFQRHLKTIKQLILEIVMMDTAYHEFGAFLMHRIYKGMAEEFDGQKVGRVIYNSKSLCDIHWFVAFNVVSQHFQNGTATKTGLNIVEVPDYGKQEQGGVRTVQAKARIQAGSVECVSDKDAHELS